MSTMMMLMVGQVCKGEELTVTYLPDTFVGCRDDRRAFLLQK